jgi:ABC-type amino acid transport system permease subunit
VDKGQMEAGRSLGFTWGQTMRKIVLPQGIKNALPTIFNEFIMLIKETSVAGYVAIVDLTKAARNVTSRTFEVFGPLLIVAIIYLILVLGLQQIQKIMERRMKQGD